MALHIFEAQDFHVGWICAVEVEYVIACELLDEEHPNVPSVSNDDENSYTCGRMGQHNVVIACLPKGEYGLTSAASVAKDMLRSFPAIHIRLMVGIGGGAPSAQNDIRLGDVVVSIPSGQAGGVTHYEMGKTVQNQKLERTGHLDAPPSVLLNAVQKLSTLHKRKGHRISQTMVAAISKNSRLQKKYTKPAASSDVLYRASFLHKDSTQHCADTCNLQEDQKVQRVDRANDEDNPAIHYGLIASADRLMKDAEIRDGLAASEKVLCFEMEAAGLMNHFRCLVIRGICDYSDTHKSDAWQGYAAATAAAYAKELVTLIPPRAIHGIADLHGQSVSSQVLVGISRIVIDP
jgi:nucleoside phosphorylase